MANIPKSVSWPAVVLAIGLAVIAATPPTLVALAALRKAESTHLLVNSRMSELLALTKAAAGDAATLAEKRAEKQRVDEKAKAISDFVLPPKGTK
jgi:hypothetical protein